LRFTKAANKRHGQRMQTPKVLSHERKVEKRGVELRSFWGKEMVANETGPS